MKRFLVSILASAFLANGFGSVPAAAQSRTDQGEARKEMRAGNILTLRQVERRIVPQMGGAVHIDTAYDATKMAYRLKFIKSGSVIFVDVDAKTGRVLRRSQ